LAYSLLRKWLGFVLAACFATGCFTTPVNMTPNVHIISRTATVPFGQSVTYTATASDPDGDSFNLFWQQTTTTPTCPPPPDISSPSTWPGPDTDWSAGSEALVPGNRTKSPFCIWVKAVDSWGAASADAIRVFPLDQAPVAMLALVSPPNALSFPPKTAFELSAEGSMDANAGDVPTFAWTAVPSTAKLMSCADAPNNSARQCFTADTAGIYQVTVVVTDGAGTTSSASQLLNVVPGPPPVARIDLVSPTGLGPYPLGSTFQLSAAQSTGDGLTYAWSISQMQKPQNSVAQAKQCSDPTSACFTADLPGLYQVGLTVTDDAGQTSTTVSPQFEVAPDQPPCIDVTMPPKTQGTTMATMFELVTASDDLDPYPGTLSYEFLVSTDGATYVPVQSDFPVYPVSPGDIYVRLQVEDRDTQRSESEFTACGDKAAYCTETSLIHPDPCYQRVTWTLLPK
jgi:hypothetical protein